MNPEELKAALEELKTSLEGKSKTEIKTALEAFKLKHKEAVDLAVKDAVDAAIKENKTATDVELKALKETLETEYKSEIKKVQDHLDLLDAKANGAKGGKAETKSYKELVSDAIVENFKSISAVRSGNSFKMDVKVVGDMTLGVHLTGDEPRVYSDQVARVPNQLLNFSDLIQSLSIDGGTYTFPRETGGEGGIAFQTEGAAKSQKDYDFTMVDVTTDFLAGFARYSKKMANNLNFLQSFVPVALRRDYLKQESIEFNGILNPLATASTQIITGKNEVEMLINEISTLEGIDFAANGIVLRPADYYKILITEKSTGAGYGLPGIVTMDAGQMRINGIPVFKANWLAANKYYVGDWSTVKKVVTEGMSVQFSTEDGDNFTKNLITARIEAQVGLAVERPDSIIYGDFTAV